MIDFNELMLRAVAEALDECGLSPQSNHEDAEEFLKALRERGYEIKKAPPEEKEENEEE